MSPHDGETNVVNEDYWPCCQCQMGFLWEELTAVDGEISQLTCKSCIEKDDDIL